MNNNSLGKVFLDGILTKKSVAALFLGTCPALAITNSVSTALGMGIAFLIVILLSNIVISLLQNIIPSSVKSVAYVIISAGFVSIISMIMNAYFFELYENIKAALPLIVINSVIMSYSTEIASEQSVAGSAANGLGFGIGFVVIMFATSTIRELFGAGTWFGMNALESINNSLSADIQPLKVLTDPAGGFIVYGALAALFAFILIKMNKMSSGEVLEIKGEN